MIAFSINIEMIARKMVFVVYVLVQNKFKNTKEQPETSVLRLDKIFCFVQLGDRNERFKSRCLC